VKQAVGNRALKMQMFLFVNEYGKEKVIACGSYNLFTEHPLSARVCGSVGKDFVYHACGYEITVSKFLVQLFIVALNLLTSHVLRMDLSTGLSKLRTCLIIVNLPLKNYCRKVGTVLMCRTSIRSNFNLNSSIEIKEVAR